MIQNVTPTGLPPAKRARQKAHNRDNEIIAWRAKAKSWREIAGPYVHVPEGVRKAYAAR